MNTPPILSIDLGASFTKVANRGTFRPWGPLQEYSEDPTLLVIDGSSLTPSLAIETGQDRKPWVFGSEAAGLVPGPGTVVHPNWKAGIFRPTNDRAAARAAIIATEFFRWLRQQIEDAGERISLHDVRFMLPAFSDVNKGAEVLRECLERAGWKPREFHFATEPHANAIGLMTGGRNRGTIFDGRMLVDFVGMYGYNEPYIQVARRAALAGGSSKLRIGIVDIGSFTTDLAILTFNVLTDAGDGLEAVTHESFPVGTYEQLDVPLWRMLIAQHGSCLEKLSFNDREEIKHALFMGEKYTLEAGKQIGCKSDFAAVDRVCKDFAKALRECVGEKIRCARVSKLLASGGGTLIAPVMVALEREEMAFSAGASAFVTLDLPSGTKEFAPWSRAGQPVQRVATCLGGASILAPLELKYAPIQRLPVEKGPKSTREPVSPPTTRECRCRGMNPDCSLCSGTGYHRVS